MNFKVVMKEEAKQLRPEGWFNAVAGALHSGDDVINGELELEIGHFLPGGKTSDLKAELETIFYVQKGEMNITMDDGIGYTLYLGDSIHIGVDTGYRLFNASSSPAELVVMKIQPNDA